MKRLFTVTLTLLALTAALCIPAAASDFDGAARDLASIGIFRGDGSGFALDRAPTRSEAAIMLVRLYGAEEQAAGEYGGGSITHPFTDVSDTAAPYAAWLKTRGIVNGVSDTAFGSARPCTLQNYTAFLLRALGYQDGKDFQYDQTLSFAVEKGLLDLDAFPGAFLRDDLAALTCQALAADLADGSTYLLDSLIQSKAIDKDAAKGLTEKIEAYRALRGVCERLGDAMDAEITAGMNLTAFASGTAQGQAVSESQTVPITYTGRVQLRTGQSPQMSMTVTGTVLDQAAAAEMWMKGGLLYVRTGNTSYKTPLRQGMEDGAWVQALDAAANIPLLPFLESIRTETSGSGTVYTVTMLPAYGRQVNDPMSSLLLRGASSEAASPLDGLDMTMKLKKCVYTYTVDKGGTLKSASAAMVIESTMDPVGLGQDRITAGLDLTAEMSMTVKAAGDRVRITFPKDLDKFPRLDA